MPQLHSTFSALVHCEKLHDSLSYDFVKIRAFSNSGDTTRSKSLGYWKKGNPATIASLRIARLGSGDVESPTGFPKSGIEAHTHEEQ